MRTAVSIQAPSGPRFLQIIVVSPVKRVGASVSIPHSSALAMIMEWVSGVEIGRERMVNAVIVVVRDWMALVMYSGPLLSSCARRDIRFRCAIGSGDGKNAKLLVRSESSASLLTSERIGRRLAIARLRVR